MLHLLLDKFLVRSQEGKLIINQYNLQCSIEVGNLFQVASTSSDEEIEREENVQVVLSGVDTLKLDDHITHTDNHEKYIEVSSYPPVSSELYVCAIRSALTHLLMHHIIKELYECLSKLL